MKLSSTHVLIAIAVLGIGLIGGAKLLEQKKSAVADGRYTQFAECLAEKGATFYGAFWCPHCQEQKALFGDAASKLPYVECSTADKSAQTQICIDKKITSYPTWILADGQILNGAISLAELSEKTTCELPL